MPTFTRKPGSAKSRSLKPLQSSHFAVIDGVGDNQLCNGNNDSNVLQQQGS